MPLQIIRQDITKMRVDAIVNTTNEKMVAGSGVDLAVHTAAGKELDAECRRLAPLGLGEAKITGGYGLPCRYVIHTSGPVWRGGLSGESIILRSCYTEALKLAVEHGCESVAFPLISSGAYGYPKDEVLHFAVRVITDFLYEHELTVYLCVFDKESYTFSRELYRNIKEYIGDAYVEKCDEAPVCRCADGRQRSLMAKRMSAPMCAEADLLCEREAISVARESLHEYLKRRDRSFREMLFDLIDRSSMTDVECYRRANVDKRVFSKIKSSNDYRPSKQTAIAFAIALRLDLDETQALLATLGFTLSQSTVFDKIIRYFIENKRYDIFEINEALFEFDQSLLGSV